MGLERLIDIIPGLGPEDVKSDTGSNLIDINSEKSLHATESRTFSFI